MIEPGFAAAALVPGFGFFLHTFTGGRLMARPLLEIANLSRASRWFNYYCWHAVTLVLVAMAAAFAWAAFDPRAWGAAVMSTVLAAGFAPLGYWIAARGGIPFYKMAPAMLFTLTALLGGWSLMT